MVHGDGKIMENIVIHAKHDLLPVKITHHGVDQLFGAPELKDRTGFYIAEKVFEILDEWNQLEKIECCCFGTTSTNTGCRMGAPIRLEKLIGRSLEDLLYSTFHVVIISQTLFYAPCLN